MEENVEIYSSASSRRAAVCTAGRVRHMVEVWDAPSGRSTATLLEETLYSTGSGHLAVADSGSLVAVGEYYNGVELWDWRSRRLVWRNSRISRIQSVAFASDDDELIVGMDTGAAALAVASGAEVGLRFQLQNPIASPFGPLIFGIHRKKMVVLRRNSGEMLAIGPRRSFGILAAAFTPGAVVVSETDGSLRAFSLKDGDLLAESDGWFLALASVAEEERITGWSAVRDEAWGELVGLDLVSGKASRIIRKHLQAVFPIRSGTAWAFADGSSTSV